MGERSFFVSPSLAMRLNAAESRTKCTMHDEIRKKLFLSVFRFCFEVMNKKYFNFN